MNEEHFSEIEATLLYISEARERAERAVTNLAKMGAKEHLVDSMRQSEAQLRDMHRSIMHGTYFSDATYDDSESATAPASLS